MKLDTITVFMCLLNSDWGWQAMDSLKVGDDALQKLGCALEAIPRAGSASSPLPVPAHGAPAMQEGDAPQGAFQPGSLGQSSSSSVTEENTENDAGTMASSSRELQARETNPCTIEAAAHDLVQHLSQAGNGSKEGAFLTELMTSCVATLFMLQVCGLFAIRFRTVLEALEHYVNKALNSRIA